MNLTLKTLLAASLLATSAIVTASCASHQHARSGGEILDDSAITTKVKSALLAEKDVNSFDIKVKTFKGDVQLSGFVDSQWQIDKAAAVVAAVSGVHHVTNDLIHKPE
jgi:hyperosmotically inducible protein